MVLALMVIVIGLSSPGSPRADVLLIEEVRQAGKMELPLNGTSRAEVRSRYGDPVKTHSAVGDPPISRWDYGSWSVYFEYDLVLFTVLHKGQVIDKNKEESR
jgi:hypothetical protein